MFFNSGLECPPRKISVLCFFVSCWNNKFNIHSKRQVFYSFKVEGRDGNFVLKRIKTTYKCDI
ncbi:Uncharacterized protein APZ42_028341 [Daphnia magna]|uniref:Uncharacterized protein n=1 Tax=Daphnia magna TaxID=35525 RepID=A0A164QQ96_9CRUS|nr:Uncharacterized protein APZ42_028341 [Daphnia magna]